MKKNTQRLLTLFLIFTLFSPTLVVAKGNKGNHWFITPRIGTATMIGEVNSSFQRVESDFDHGMGISADLEFSRTIGSHFELGLNIGFYSLSSSNDSLFIQDLSVVQTGNLPPSFQSINIWPKPIEYRTTAIVPKVIARYYFLAFSSRARSESKFQPYVEVSAGFNFHSPELNYSDTTGIIIQEGEVSNLPSVWYLEKYEDKIPYPTTEQALQFGLGIGSRFTLNGGLTFNLAAELSGIQTQHLDALPNMEEDDVSSSLVARIMFGVAIPLNAGRTKGGQYLPWAP